MRSTVATAPKYGHSIEVMNGTQGDAIVKLKRAGDQHTVVSPFITKGGSLKLTSIPNGTYRIQFAFGGLLDERCENFLDLAGGKEFPNDEVLQARELTGGHIETDVIEYTLYSVPSGNVEPYPISAARFSAD